MAYDTLGLPVAGARLPVLGHLARLYGDQRRFFARLAARGPLVWFDMGARDWALLYARPEAYGLLQDPAATSSHIAPSTGPIVGDAIIGRDGPPHRRVRGALNRPFAPQGLRSAEVGSLMASIVERKVAAMVRGPSSNVLDAVRELALEIIFRVLGVPAGDLPAWSRRYRALLGGFVQIAGWLPGTPSWQARRARRWLDRRFKALLDEARAGLTPEGLLGGLVSDARDVSEPELLDNLRLIALAGHETSASVMAWAVLYVLRDRELLRRLGEEARSHGELPRSPEDLARFPLAEGVFREVLRLHPPVSFTQRTLAEPVELAGVSLPPGAKVTVPIEWLSRHPAHFERPEDFWPERWPALGRAPRTVERIQFGAGPHFCLGYHLAWLEIVQLVVSLAVAAPVAGTGRSLPSRSYFPLLHPRRRDTWVRFGR